MTRETAVYLSFSILLSISLCLLTNISPFLNQDTLSKEVFNLTEVFRSVSDLNKEFLFKWGPIMLIYSSKLLLLFKCRNFTRGALFAKIPTDFMLAVNNHF